MAMMLQASSAWAIAVELSILTLRVLRASAPAPREPAAELRSLTALFFITTLCISWGFSP
jgi:hypothetical protein